MTQSRWATGRPVRSLHWDGEDLVDWVDGGTRWRPDGVRIDSHVRYPYVFDRAVVSISGRYQVLYTECGTKGLVLDAGQVLREINRSYYHANDYEYPIAMGRLPDGREVLVHCPDYYNKLELEDIASGHRLTQRTDRGPDVFHSRLSLSPGGRRLLSGGWLWDPFGVAEVFDLTDVLRDQYAMDRRDVALGRALDTEVVASCWLTDDLLVVAAAAATDEEDSAEEEDQALGPGKLGVWSIDSAGWLHRSQLDYRCGLLLSCGPAVLGLYDHPKLIDPATGAILAQWPDLLSGQREHPYRPRPLPPIAVHPSGNRFAIVQDSAIVVAAISV